jgi:hypothetical protein
MMMEWAALNIIPIVKEGATAAPACWSSRSEVNFTPQGSISPTIRPHAFLNINISHSIPFHSLTPHHKSTLSGIVLSVNHVLTTTEERSCNSMTVHVSCELDTLSPQLPSAFAAVSDTITTETWFRYTPLFRGDAAFTRYRTRSLTASYICSFS